MIQVDRALFSNVLSAVQRTANLPGGGVRGLPGGVVVQGLQGVGSFGADIQEAQKEFEKGRVRTSLERVRQLDSLFQSISGRWASSVNGVLSSARTGTQQLPMQKLNELKNAQAKMSQLTRPATKAFQELITALEIAVTNEGRKVIADEDVADEDVADKSASNSGTDQESNDPKASTPAPAQSDAERSNDEPDHPSTELLGQYATNYSFGDKLTIKKTRDGKTRVVPALEENRFYFFHGMDPPRVLRVREVQRNSILVFDTYYSQESTIDTKQLVPLLREGIWRLESKG